MRNLSIHRVKDEYINSLKYITRVYPNKFQSFENRR